MLLCDEIKVWLIPRRRQWHPTPVLLPGKSHGQRSLVDCSPWGHEESDMTEKLHFHFSLLYIGEGNGNPLHCSCLENPRDGVAQSWTQLKWLSSSSNSKEGRWDKASGGDGIPAELFQILKYDAVKVLHSICQQIWKTQQWSQDWKSPFSFQSQRKALPKNTQTTTQLYSSHTLLK